MTEFSGSEVGNRIVFGAAKKPAAKPQAKPVAKPQAKPAAKPKSQIKIQPINIAPGKSVLETRVYDKKTGKLISRIDSNQFPTSKASLAKNTLLQTIQKKALSDAAIVHVVLRDSRGWHAVHKGSASSLKQQRTLKGMYNGFGSMSSEEVTVLVDAGIAEMKNVISPDAAPVIVAVIAASPDYQAMIEKHARIKAWSGATEFDLRVRELNGWLMRDAGWQNPDTIGPWVAPPPKTLDEAMNLVSARYLFAPEAKNAAKALLAANPSAAEGLVNNAGKYIFTLALYDWLKQNGSDNNILGPYFGTESTAPAPPAPEGGAQPAPIPPGSFTEQSPPQDSAAAAEEAFVYAQEEARRTEEIRAALKSEQESSSQPEEQQEEYQEEEYQEEEEQQEE